MSVDGIEIRRFVQDDADEIVEFSLRAWATVFASVRQMLGDPIFLRLYPDWESSQAEIVSATFADARRDVFVAVADGRQVGFVAVALDAFWQGMGCFWPLGVDPDYQHRGVGEALTSFALDYMRQHGMDVAGAEAGYDTGHARPDALYRSMGFTPAPAARYFRLLDDLLRSRDANAPDTVEIREILESDLDAVVEFSIQAWATPHASMRRAFGDSIYVRLYPDWERSQSDTVRTSCTSDTTDTLVAVAGGRPIGFVTVAFNTYWEGMGEVSIIAVDPNHQHRGIGQSLIVAALDRMCDRGMDSAVVETGNDPGHAPARALYASTGFTLLPVGRYFQLIDEPSGRRRT